MSKAMEQIVRVYVQHQNRRVRSKISGSVGKGQPHLDLKDPRTTGLRLHGLPIRQINAEIAAIEAGLERLVVAAKAA